MKKIKVLNNYCGLGGNRLKWRNVKVTAIEKDPDIAAAYKNRFPQDHVIVTDAHNYLLQHFREFDFIWSSPPCPSHSRIFKAGVKSDRRKNKIYKYPDMKLYQEIILLQHFFKGGFVVENVIPYYDSLIAPNRIIGRHNIWSNYFIYPFKNNSIKNVVDIKRDSVIYGFKTDFEYKKSVRVLRDLVDPELGLHLFNCFTNKFPEVKFGLFE